MTSNTCFSMVGMASLSTRFSKSARISSDSIAAAVTLKAGSLRSMGSAWETRDKMTACTSSKEVY